MYTRDCNYFRITNYNNIQEGYYRRIGRDTEYNNNNNNQNEDNFNRR